MNSKGLAGLAVLCCLASVPTLRASTIDFEGLSYPTHFAGDIVANGYSFDLLADHGHLLGDEHLGLPSNGSHHLDIDDEVGENPVTMSPLAGGPFTLRSADFAEFFYAPSTELLITGYFSGAGEITTSFVFDGIVDGPGKLPDFQTLVFGPEWTGLTRVAFDSVQSLGPHAGWALDNIVVENVAVPEPGTAALLVCGLLGLRWFAGPGRAGRPPRRK